MLYLLIFVAGLAAVLHVRSLPPRAPRVRFIPLDAPPPGSPWRPWALGMGVLAALAQCAFIVGVVSAFHSGDSLLDGALALLPWTSAGAGLFGFVASAKWSRSGEGGALLSFLLSILGLGLGGLELGLYFLARAIGPLNGPF